MLKNYSLHFGFVSKILEKFFFIFITIISLKISDQLYSLVILSFVVANYFYEICSLSIPKIYNNYYKNKGFNKLSILVGGNIFISILLFVIFTIFLLKISDLIFKDNNAINNHFIFIFVTLGFSIFLNDLIDRYNFLKLNHLQIYIFDILSLLAVLVVIIVCLKFNILTENQVFNIIFAYVFLTLVMKLIKFFLFKSDIQFNLKKIYLTFNFDELINLIKLILPILIVSILILSQLNISRFLILSFENYNNFAVFVFHVQIIELISIFFMVIHQLVNPKISILVRNQYKNLFFILKNKLLNIFICVVPILILFIFFSIEEIIKILGINFQFDKKLFLILSVNFFLIYLFFTLYQYMVMINYKKLLIKLICISLLLNLVLSLILLNVYSIFGLAYANLISNLFLFFICNMYTNFFIIRKKDLSKLLIIFMRLIFLIVLMNFYKYLFSFENNFIIFITKSVYFISIFFISEIFITKKFKLYNMLYALIKIINLKNKNEK